MISFFHNNGLAEHEISIVQRSHYPKCVVHNIYIYIYIHIYIHIYIYIAYLGPCNAHRNVGRANTQGPWRPLLYHCVRQVFLKLTQVLPQLARTYKALSLYSFHRTIAYVTHTHVGFSLRVTPCQFL